MKIAIISGSHRPTGNSGRIARSIEKQLKAQGHDTYVLDLATTELPFWDEGLWGMEGLSAKWEKVWNPIQTELAEADAYVVLAPEYHGMAPSKLTNFFLLLGNGATVAHKPALLVTVSSGVGGVYPIAELRSYSYKNNRLCYIPEQLIIRNAGEMLVDNVKPEHAESNAIVAERLDWLLKLLGTYAMAFQGIREAAHITHPKFANGM